MTNQSTLERISSSSKALPKQVVQAFAPAVHLHPEEQYFPCSVEWFFQRVSLWNDNSQQLISSGKVNSDSLIKAQQTYLQSKLSLRLDPSKDYNKVNPHNPRYFGQKDSLDAVPCYYLVRFDPSAGLYYIRYFFFYAYNGGLIPSAINQAGYLAHEGDWEYITAIVGWNESAETATLHGVSYSGHGYTTDWVVYPNAKPQDYKTLTPIVVYSAKHSHASYPKAGQFDLENIPAALRPLIDGYDHTGNGALWQTSNNLVEISLQDTGIYTPLWASYKGKWGTDIVIKDALNKLDSSIIVRGGGPTGPVQKNLENFLYYGSQDVYYAPQNGQSFRTSNNFSHWDSPPLGYLNVAVESTGDPTYPVITFKHDKSGQDTTWYSYKQNGNSFPVLSDQPNNHGGTGLQQIYAGTESPIPFGLKGSDTYRLTVSWSLNRQEIDRPAAKMPPGAILMSSIYVSYKPQHGQKFRSSNNINNWDPQPGDSLFFEVELLDGQTVYPSFAVVHDKAGKDRIWYKGVTDGSFFDVNAQNGGSGKQKIYIGTQSALPPGVEGADIYRVNIYRVPHY